MTAIAVETVPDPDEYRRAALRTPPGSARVVDATGISRAARTPSDPPLPARMDTLAPVPPSRALARPDAPGRADRRVHLGYAVPRGSSPRERRAVTAACLLRVTDVPFVDVMMLHDCHAIAFGDPGCTPATYARTLAGFPHLLVRGAAHQWAVLDDERLARLPAPALAGTSMPERRAPDPRESEDAEASAPGRHSVAARVRDCLHGDAVLTTGQLVARLGDVSRSTVTGALDDDPTVRRYAPGLLASHARLDAITADPPTALLDEAQWRWLSDALRSGERPTDPDPLFPAWRAESVDALVRWGRDRGLRLADARERLRDADLRALHGGFEPRHLIAMVIACAGRSSIGWMRLNRLLGARIDSRGAIWPAALLASLGVVTLDDHWQHPLATDRDRARRLRAGLFALARSRTRLSWRDPDLRALLRRFDARDDVGSATVGRWLRSRRVAHFVDARMGAGAEA